MCLFDYVGLLEVEGWGQGTLSSQELVTVTERHVTSLNMMTDDTEI